MVKYSWRARYSGMVSRAIKFDAGEWCLPLQEVEQQKALMNFASLPADAAPGSAKIES